MDFDELTNLDPFEFLKYLMSLGVILGQRECSNCPDYRPMKLFKKKNSPEQYCWRCTKCKRSSSVRTGSFFERFDLPIKKVLEVIEFWAKERKIIDMEESIKVSKPTLVRICRFLRQLCILDLDKDNILMGGLNEIVEIDESVFNKVKYNRGKDMQHYTKEKQLWVFGFKERSTGKCFFQVK